MGVVAVAVEDTYLARVTEAPTEAAAMGIIRQVKPAVVKAMYDLMGYDPEGHGVPWLRREVVREARA
jgi:hypothetical protein